MLFRNKYNLNEKAIWIIAGVCILPLVFNLFGYDFGTIRGTLDPFSVKQVVEFESRKDVSGIFKGQNFHTIFVSFSITVAFLTAFLSFIDFGIKGDISTPIVGIALFCAGLLDVFHILVSTQIVNLPDEQFFITAFTWFFCRLFHASILIFGVGLFLWKKEWFLQESQQNARRFVGYISIIFVGLTIITIILLANSEVQASAYPFRNKARPYDLIPLALYIFSALYLMPKFYRQHPSTFSQTLWLSLIPAIATQMYMTFGSAELYDNSFNIAHILTAFTYFIPFIGLGLNYIESHQNERMEAEKRKIAQEKLLESEKLTVTGRLARTIAHEVRNPLTNINMSLEQLKESLEHEKDSSALYTDIIKRNSDRINQLISELLNISRPAALDMKSLSVNELLEESLKLATDRIHLKKIKMVKNMDKEIPYKMLDEEKMRTAFLNIIINAVEAMEEEKGVLTINTRRDNGYCIVEISDNGHGISPENLQNLFQPFFSQKTKGMGLGLTASQNIIMTHKGSIDVESKEGEGTKITIAL